MDKYEVWIGNDKGHPFVGIEADGKERRKYAHFWNELPQDWLLGVMMDGHGRRVREVPADVLVAVEWDTETTSPSSLVAEGAGSGNSAPEADLLDYQREGSTEDEDRRAMQSEYRPIGAC